MIGPEDHPFSRSLLMLYGGSEREQAFSFMKESIPRSLNNESDKAVERLPSNDNPCSFIQFERENPTYKQNAR